MTGRRSAAGRRLAAARLAVALLLAGAAGGAQAQGASTFKIDQDGLYGCTNLDQYDGMRNFEARGDRDGLNKALPMSKSLGVCVVFDRGEELTIVPGGARPGVVRVKRTAGEKIYFTAAPPAR